MVVVVPDGFCHRRSNLPRYSWQCGKERKRIVFYFLFLGRADNDKWRKERRCLLLPYEWHMVQ